MLEYIEYLNVPVKVAIGLMVTFFVIQVVGEILEFRGKVVPEFAKVRKYVARRKNDKRMIREISSDMNEVKKFITEMNKRCGADDVEARKAWSESVDRRLEQNDKLIGQLIEKLDKNNADTLSLLIDAKRNAIISFAGIVVDEDAKVTREQFNRVFKQYEEYEALIEANGLTNGETDIAFRIIGEAYELRMRNHSFIEDLRGYN